MKIGFISLGCSKNLTDTETMMGQVLKEHQLVNSMEQADIMVVNSCSFIDPSRQETIDTLNELKDWKSANKKVVLTGCYVEEVKDRVFELYPFIDGVINMGAISKINQLIAEISTSKEHYLHYESSSNNFLTNDERFLATPKHYSYLKIGDGCDNCCSYCRIPILRGSAIYKNPIAVIEEATILANKGVKELILVAQDTTSYQWENNYNLVDLLKDLENINKIEWIRLMYCYPDKISPQLIEQIKISKKIVKYIDMPIQHINDTILDSMNRHSSRAQIVSTINQLRQEIPEIKLRTTMLVGYPGETQEMFEELYGFAKDTRFDHLGVFTYSNEVGTASFNMRGQVEDTVKEKRFHKLMSLQKRISKDLNKQYLGTELNVLIDNLEGGRRYFDAPDIDGFVRVLNVQRSDIGQLKKVRIRKSLEYDLIGDIV